MVDLIESMKSNPLLGTLLVLMVLDIFLGILVATVQKQISSTISWRGMTKKAGTIAVIAAAMLIEPELQGFPAAATLILFYSVTEWISITEKAGILGIPMPKALRDALKRLRGEKESTFSIEWREQPNGQSQDDHERGESSNARPGMDSR